MIKLQHSGFTIIELMMTLLIVSILAKIALASYREHMEEAKYKTAATDIRAIEAKIEGFFLTTQQYPDNINQVFSTNDPWGNPYQYLNMALTKGNGQKRKNRSLVPVNSDYDLYSMGPDGRSASPFTAKASHDDVVRANDGDYVGKVKDY